MHVQRTPDCHRPVQIGQREGNSLRRDVHVALVRPRAAQRGAPERQRFEVRDDAGRAGCVSGHQIEHRLRGVARDHLASQFGRMPARSAAQVEAYGSRRNPFHERGERTWDRARFLGEPLRGTLFVQLDGRAVHGREEWHV